jgi:histidine triad (HIT) family protein
MATVFERIRKRELPARIFFEDDKVMVIADHSPKDPVHLLIIPHEVYPDFYRTPPEVMSMLMDTARMVADRLGIAGHFRLVINNGYRQEIDHIHVHFLSNRGADRLTWLEG